MPNSPSLYEVQITSEHLDMFGHVNNAEYLRILEAARWEMIESNHYGRAMVEKTQEGPVILELNLRFKKELLIDQLYLIQTSSAKVSDKIFKLSQTILNDQKEVCCLAEFTMGFLDLKKRKLIPMSEAWKTAIHLE